jgi:hypothetical protein
MQIRSAEERPQDAASFEIEPIIVSGEVSPLYLSGIIFTSQNTPLRFPGVVSAVMTRRIDPYTNQERPGLPTINAICYLASSDEGRYLIPGVAPGIYDVYASTLGSPRSLIASGLIIQGARQPESLDGQVQRN